MHPVELTERQTEVLSLLAQGLDLPQIARQLQFSVYTARSHLRDLLPRLKAANGTHAVAIAIGLGILPSDVATKSSTLIGVSHVR
ncbi:response regulator transcription factor [Kitasatospora sp. NPDC001175]|uniref:response regulator transcription factor n=1 Tax=Kitasatospora sp. NPDC001175 TaxID=3157103 RepID=UPI003CFF62D1